MQGGFGPVSTLNDSALSRSESGKQTSTFISEPRGKGGAHAQLPKALFAVHSVSSISPAHLASPLANACLRVFTSTPRTTDASAVRRRLLPVSGAQGP